jgi:hypothetical protein
MRDGKEIARREIHLKWERVLHQEGEGSAKSAAFVRAIARVLDVSLRSWRKRVAGTALLP